MFVYLIFIRLIQSASIYIYISISISLYLYVCIYLSLSLSLYLYLYLSLSLFLYLSRSIYRCIHSHMPWWKMGFCQIGGWSSNHCRAEIPRDAQRMPWRQEIWKAGPAWCADCQYPLDFQHVFGKIMRKP